MPDKDISARLEAVRQSYINSLSEKRNDIETYWHRLTCEHWNKDEYDRLYIILHGLAGSAETFGLPEISRTARIVVDELKRCTESSMPDKHIQQQLAEKINAVISQLKNVS